MNTPSDIAFIGPILWFGVMAFSFWFIIQRVKSISTNIKQHKEWQLTEKDHLGKSAKNKKNKKGGLTYITLLDYDEDTNEIADYYDN
jgi:hypothetical protein